jgi:hypothetical protein
MLAELVAEPRLLGEREECQPADVHGTQDRDGAGVHEERTR